MLITSDIKELRPYSGRVAVAVGVFDGVHTGHRTILGEMVAGCRELGLYTVTMTFEPHPVEVLNDEAGATRVTDLAEKARLIASTGVDILLTVPFDCEFAGLPAVEFVGDFLVGNLAPQTVYVGFNFGFGRRGEGNTQTLSDLGRKHGFAVRVFGPLMDNGTVVSSTKVRDAVAAGDIRFAGKLLGRPYRLRGRVVSGDHRGSGMGIPTANVEPQPRILRPGGGVYAAWAGLDGRAWPAVVNVGNRPTFGDGGKTTIEAHLIGFAGSIYGRDLEILFIERLRDERRFASAGDLANQISADIKNANAALKMGNPSGPTHKA